MLSYVHLGSMSESCAGTQRTHLLAPELGGSAGEGSGNGRQWGGHAGGNHMACLPNRGLSVATANRGRLAPGNSGRLTHGSAAHRGRHWSRGPDGNHPAKGLKSVGWGPQANPPAT